MNVLAISSTMLVGIILAVVVLAIVIGTVWLRKRRKTIWQKFARRHKLKWRETLTEENDPIITISGTVAGRKIELTTAPESSDTGPLGIEEVRLSVMDSFPKMPDDLQIHSATGFVGELQKSLEVHQVVTENEDFNQHAVVTSKDAAAAKLWLTNQRQQAISQLVEKHPEKQLTINAKGLSLQTREAVSQLESLDDMLQSLISTDDALR